jgi:hypothetical protein
MFRLGAGCATSKCIDQCVAARTDFVVLCAAKDWRPNQSIHAVVREVGPARKKHWALVFHLRSFGIRSKRTFINVALGRIEI